MNYAEFVTTIADLVPVDEADPSFVIQLPNAIAYAENRICREIDFLANYVSPTIACTPNSREVDLTALSPQPLVIDIVNVVTPTATLPAAGTRNPTQRVTRNFLDFTYPSIVGTGGTGVPIYWALSTDLTLLLGPAPDAAYKVELYMSRIPVPLSASNTTTYLASKLSDLLIAAAMIYISGWMRDFGSQGEDPAQAVSWESQYSTLRASALVQSERQKFKGADMTSEMPNGIAAKPSSGTQP